MMTVDKEEVVVVLRERIVARQSSSSAMTVPPSSPLFLASMTASFMSLGIGAWMEVMSFA